MLKNLIFVIIFLFPIFSFAQKDSITFNQTQDIQFAKQYKNDTEIDFYTTKDGLKISIGDTLTIGKAIINRKRYFINDVFTYIVVGNTRSTNKTEFTPLPHKYNGRKVIVKSIFVTHERLNGYKFWSNRNNRPLYVSIFVRNPHVKLKSRGGLLNKLSYSRKTILDIEKALSSGEIVNKYAPLTREEAILKLKESKNLLDLDFLSQESYDSLRNKLSPIILDK